MDKNVLLVSGVRGQIWLTTVKRAAAKARTSNLAAPVCVFYVETLSSQFISDTMAPSWTKWSGTLMRRWRSEAFYQQASVKSVRRLWREARLVLCASGKEIERELSQWKISPSGVMELFPLIHRKREMELPVPQIMNGFSGNYCSVWEQQNNASVLYFSLSIQTPQTTWKVTMKKKTASIEGKWKFRWTTNNVFLSADVCVHECRCPARPIEKKNMRNERY